MGIPNKIKISGKVFIKYVDDLSKASCGDLKLYLNDDQTNPFPGDYHNLTSDGYIKCKIFDGSRWHRMDITEFCENREHKFPKKQRAIDSALLCKEVMSGFGDIILIKKYRGHFSRHVDED
jgi:hypothetical protein